MSEWIVDYVILPTALGGNIVGVLCVLLGAVLLVIQLPQLMVEGFRADASPNLDVFKFSIPASLLMLLIGLVTLYFFTVGRVWEYQKADPCVATGVVRFGAFDGEGDPQLEKLIRGFNDLNRATGADDLTQRSEYIARVLSSDDSRAVVNVIRYYLVYTSLGEKQKYVFCRLVNEGKISDIQFLADRLNKGVEK